MTLSKSLDISEPLFPLYKLGIRENDICLPRLKGRGYRFHLLVRDVSENKRPPFIHHKNGSIWRCDKDIQHTTPLYPALSWLLEPENSTK